MFKRVMSLLLALVLLIGCIPPTAVRAEEVQTLTEEGEPALTTEQPSAPETEEPEETTAPASVPEESAEPESAPEEATVSASVPEETMGSEPEETAQATEPALTEPETEPVPEQTESAVEQETVVAAEEAMAGVSAEGVCGENAIWKLTEDGTLTISGKGAMYDYDVFGGLAAPWSEVTETENIRRVVVEEGITSIGDASFEYCSNLTSVSLPSTLTRIGASSFWFCENLTSITIPNGVTQLGSMVFFQCHALESIVIPDTVTEIGEGCFYVCESLKSIKIPQGVTTIGEQCFAACESLTSITIPESVTSMGSGCFSFCSSLKTITLPSRITSLGDSCFADCSSLTAITIPEKVNSLGDDCFSSCTGLTSVTIPASVTSLGQNCFAYSDNLTSVKFEGSAPAFSEDVFSWVTAIVQYPANDPSWTESVMQNYGGNLTWESYATVPNTPCGDALTWNISGDGILAIWGSGSMYDYEDAAQTPWAHYSNAITGLFLEKGITKLGDNAFTDTQISHVYYTGSSADWADEITLGNNKAILDKARIYYNSKNLGQYNSVQEIQNGTFYYNKNDRYTFDYDDSWFFNSSTRLQYDLLRMSIRGAMAGYGAAMGESKAKNGRNISRLMTDLGFTNQIIEYPKPDINSIGYAIGSKNLENSDGKKATVIMVAVRGGNYGAEWGGNFNMGAARTEHSGFEIGAIKLIHGLEKYVEENKRYFDGNVKVWIMGYSRGAAVANLAAAQLNNGEIDGIDSGDVYAYCFACPKGTTSEDAHSSKYDNIVCVVNTIDVVPKVAPGYAGFQFTRYGKTYYTPASIFNWNYAFLKASAITEYTEIVQAKHPDWSLTECAKEALELTKEDLGQSEDFDQIIASLCAVVGSRRKFYTSGIQDELIPIIAKTMGGADDVEVDYLELALNIAKVTFNHADAVILKNTILDAIRGSVGAFVCLKRSHYAELCLAWIEVSEDYLMQDPKTKKLFFNCPVDVSVYDSEGTLVARFVDDVPQEIENGLPAYVDMNGQKVVCTPPDGEYRVEITATGDGQLTYSVVEEDYETGAAQSLVSFQEVPIAAGDQLSGTLDAAGAAPTLEKNDEPLAPDVTQEGGEIAFWTVKVNAGPGGEAAGGGSFLSGEFAKVTAAADPGWNFAGWYDEEDTFLSSDAEYRFCVKKDTVLTAKFAQKTGYAATPLADAWICGAPADIRFQISAGEDRLVSIALDGSDLEGYTYENGLLVLPREVLMPLRAGTHTLEVQFDRGYAGAEFTVIPCLVIEAEKTGLTGGEALQLSPVILPEGTAMPPLRWSIPEAYADSASVSETGLVTIAAGAGAEKILVQLDAADDSCAGTQIELDIAENVRIVTNKGAAPETSLISGKSASYGLLDGATGKLFGKKAVKWSLRPQDGAVAKVSSSGKLTAKTVYERRDVVLTAQAEDVSCSLTVTLIPKTTHLELSLGLMDENGQIQTLPKGTVLPLEPKGTLTLTSVSYPEDALGEVTWSVSKKKNAAVEDGVVTPLKNGTVTITAKTADGSNKKATVKVEIGAMAQTVTVSSPETTLRSGSKAMQLTAQALDADGQQIETAFRWSVDNADAASVSSKGKLTAKTVYEPTVVTVTAAAKDAAGAAGSREITILPETDDVLVIRQAEKNVAGSTLYCDISDEIQLKAFSGREEADVQWKSGSEKIARVEQDGTLTLVKPGKTTITAVQGRRSAKVTLMISAQITGITISGGKELSSGKSMKLTARVEPEAAGKDIAWQIVAGEEWASLSSSGTLKAAKNLSQMRRVLVKAVAGDGSGVESNTIVVTLRPMATGVVLFDENGHILEDKVSWDAKDSERTLTAKVYPWRASQSLDWRSSNSEIASITENEDGTVRVLPGRAGTATITAAAQDGSGKKASFKLTVTKQITDLKLEDQILAGGKTLSLSKVIQITPQDTTTKKLTWELVDPADKAYVTLSSSGSLRAKTVARKTEIRIRVTARDAGGKQAEGTVTLWPAARSVAIFGGGKDISGKTWNLAADAKLILTAKVLEETACQQVLWTSGDPDIAQVSETGQVTPLRTGRATITATAADGTGKKATVKITVIPAATELILTSSRYELPVGLTAQLTAAVNPGAIADIRFTSSDESVAKVSASGLITPLSLGTATITAANYNGRTAAVDIRVCPEPTQAALRPETLTLGLRETFQLRPVTDSTQDIGWDYESSDARVASVDETGVITARKAGAAVITARSYNGLAAECQVTVVKAPASIVLSADKLPLSPGQQRQLEYTLTEGAEGAVTWTSSDEDVAAVGQDGMVRAIAPGTAKITVKSFNGKKATCTVTVYDPKNAIHDLRVEDGQVIANVTTAEECTLTVEMLDEDTQELLMTAGTLLEAGLSQRDVTAEPPETLPAYFLLKAVLLDVQGQPLCGEYFCQSYTREYERIRSASPKDYPDHVILDFEDMGFAALSQDVIQISGASVEGDRYTFETGQLLFPGDALILTETNEPVKIQSLTRNADGTVTVVKDPEPNISDFYDALHIRAAVDLGSQISGTKSGARRLSVPIQKTVKAGPVTLNCDVTCGLFADLDYEKRKWETDYRSFICYLECIGSLSAEAKGSFSTLDMEKNPLSIPIYGGTIDVGSTGITLEGEVLTLEANVDIDAVGQAHCPVAVRVGFTLDSDNGMREYYENTSNFTCTLDGSFLVTAGPKLDLGFHFRDFLNAGITGEVAVQAEGELKAFAGKDLEAEAVEAGQWSYHACQACVDIAIDTYAHASVSCDYKFSDTFKGDLVDWEIRKDLAHLGDAYLSLLNEQESVHGGEIAFDGGTCPNYKHCAIIRTLDVEEAVVTGLPITVSGANMTANTPASGPSTRTVFLYPGAYTAEVTFEGHADGGLVTQPFEITDAPLPFDIEEPETEVKGIVKDNNTGEPISGARVTLTLPDGSARGYQTGASGSYSFQDLLPGEYRLQASADNYEPDAGCSVTFLRDTRNNADISLVPMSRLPLLEARTPYPYDGKTVQALPKSGVLPEGVPVVKLSAKSDRWNYLEKLTLSSEGNADYVITYTGYAKPYDAAVFCVDMGDGEYTYGLRVFYGGSNGAADLYILRPENGVLEAQKTFVLDSKDDDIYVTGKFSSNTKFSGTIYPTKTPFTATTKASDIGNRTGKEIYGLGSMGLVWEEKEDGTYNILVTTRESCLANYDAVGGSRTRYVLKDGKIVMDQQWYEAQ